MATQSSFHFYLNWAKERLDEMDATLASLETKVSEVQADARVKANQVLADLRTKRDDFRSTVKKQAEANEVAWTKAKAQLETEWSAFETEVKKYVDTFGKKIEQQQGTFKLQAAAQRPRPCWTSCTLDLTIDFETASKASAASFDLCDDALTAIAQRGAWQFHVEDRSTRRSIP